MLMSIELMLLAVNLNFVLFSVFLDDIVGQIFALLVLTVAAAESAIGLALLVVYYRVRGTIAVEFINLIKGKKKIKNASIRYTLVFLSIFLALYFLFWILFIIS